MIVEYYGRSGSNDPIGIILGEGFHTRWLLVSIVINERSEPTDIVSLLTGPNDREPLPKYSNQIGFNGPTDYLKMSRGVGKSA